MAENGNLDFLDSAPGLAVIKTLATQATTESRLDGVRGLDMVAKFDTLPGRPVSPGH
jgi:hypothetical protein